MAPIMFPVGLVVALVGVMVVRHHNHGSKAPKTTGAFAQAQSDDTTRMRTSALELARNITPPTVSLQRGGEYEHGEWWGEQDEVLKAAWKEWWRDAQDYFPRLNHHEMLHPPLRDAVQKVRNHPTEETENELKSLFEPIMTKEVYKIPFFTPQGVKQLRQHLDAASYHYEDNNVTTHAAGIPTRRPNGMNRYGVIIDPNVEGAVAYQGINDFMKQVVDDYVRPLSRMLFPEITSRHNPEDDEEFYPFTIRYRSDLDMELAEHSDASVYTININLNMPENDYSGSSLYFVDSDTSQQHHTNFDTGMAVLHRGQTRHAALPIKEGERHNLVIWLFGRHAYVRIAEYDEKERLTVRERWSGGGSSSSSSSAQA